MPDAAAADRARQLFEDNRRLAFWALSRFVRRAGRAGDDDLEQVALLGLLAAAREYDPARGVKFSTYASTVIHNALARHSAGERRTARPLVPLADEPAAPAVDRPEYEPWEAADLAARLLARLPEPDRQLVRARFGIGAPPREVRAIARERGVSKQAVSARLNNVLRRLRVCARRLCPNTPQEEHAP